MFIKYIKYAIREFLGFENDFESLLLKQDQILDQLKNVEQLELANQTLIISNHQTNYYDYLTVKNALWVLFILGFIGGGFWLYNANFFNDSTLESLKSLGSLSKDLQNINQKGVLEALYKLNENSVNLSKEELKLLLEIKNLLLSKGINENKSLDKPLNLNARFTLGNPIEGIDN